MIADLIRKFIPTYESKKEMAERFTRTVQDLQKQLAFKEGRQYSAMHVIQDHSDAFAIVMNHILDEEPIDYVKEAIVRQMAYQLEPVITWDVKDAETVPKKILVGRIEVYLRKENPFNDDRNRRRV
jgi:nitrogen regulatory protein PII-like uncharacterized protein